jgi:hypothetical protein
MTDPLTRLATDLGVTSSSAYAEPPLPIEDGETFGHYLRRMLDTCSPAVPFDSVAGQAPAYSPGGFDPNLLVQDLIDSLRVDPDRPLRVDPDPPGYQIILHGLGNEGWRYIDGRPPVMRA